MSAIRLAGAVALAGLLAGCAGTKMPGPSAVSTKQTTAAPTMAEKKAPPSRVVPRPALPERVAAAPRSFPATRAPAPAAPPVYLPQRTVAAPSLPVETVPKPRYEPVPEPRYEPVETVAVPTPEPVAAEPAYEPAPESRYEPVKTVVAPELTYVPVETAARPADPVVETRSEPSRYTSIGDLDRPAPVPAPVPAAPAPSYKSVALDAPMSAAVPSVRAMAPIRDDPKDGRNGRSAARAETKRHARKGYRRNAALRAGGLKPKVRSNFTPAFGMKLEQAALARINPRVRYDARYVKIGYPWGDVDETTGVCTDVVIRSYRKLGIDLQQLVHEDMKRAFRAYPSRRIYGLKTADANIDHRRVVNLEAFFERTGASVPIGTGPEDFRPGDVLTWRLSGNEPHIGIVVADRDPRSGYPLVVHNLGAGVRKDDLISLDPPVGHFRFAPDTGTMVAALDRRKEKGPLR